MIQKIYMQSRCFVFSLALVLALCLSLLPLSPVQVSASSDTESGTDVSWPSGPSVNAESAVVLELSTGTILYEKNADTDRKSVV